MKNEKMRWYEHIQDGITWLIIMLFLGLQKLVKPIMYLLVAYLIFIILYMIAN